MQLVEAKHLGCYTLPSVGFNYGRLEHWPGVSLGPQPSKDDPRCLTLSSKHSAWSAPMVLPFGLRNTTVTVSHLVA